MLLANKDELAALLLTKKPIISEKTYQMRLAANPNMQKRYQAQDILKFYTDCGFHIDFLSRAISYDSPAIFTDYLLWVRRLFQHLPVSQESIQAFFHTFAEVIAEEVDSEQQYGLRQYLDEALFHFAEPFSEAATYLDESKPYGKIARHVLDTLLAGNKLDASKYVMDTVKSGMSIRDCYLYIIQPLQYEVGRLWHAGMISVGLEHYVTAASQMLMSQFYPVIMDHPDTGKRIVAACISGEQHEVGLRMVSDLMELEGWDTVFLGANTPLETIPQTARDMKADLLAVSVTLSIHLDKLKELIKLCRVQAPNLKIMVGGYPFNLDKELWNKIGADAYAEDALNAIAVAGKLIG